MSLRDQLTKAICALPGVEQRKSRFSDHPAFFIGALEFAHFHDGNVIDIRLTKAVIRQLAADGEVDSRLTVRSSSDWAEFAFASDGDLVVAMELIEDAVQANR